MKVIIVGAGIGGLATAHYLAKYSDYDIHIYEQSDRIGGLAASDRTTFGMPIQHAPRIILPNYDLLVEIMNELTFDENNSVADKLVPVESILISNQKVEHINIMKNHLSFSENLHLGYTLLDGLLSCQERAEELDMLPITEIVKSKSGLQWLNILSHVAGEPIKQMPTYKFLRFLEVELKTLLKENKTKESYALSGPYNEYFLDKWQQHLSELGVVFHLNTKVHRIESKKDDQLILSVQEAYGDIMHEKTDHLVVALDITSLNNFLKHSELDTYYCLAERTFSEQLGLQLGFSTKIRLPYKKAAFYALDTPWQLIVEPQEVNFEEDVYLGDDIKALWSITIPDINLFSNRLGKTVKEAIPSEIISEVLNQIKDALHVQPKLLHSHINTPIKPYTWNATNTLHMRPPTKIAPNIYLASSIVKNPYYFTYKEGACEAGLLAAEAILKKHLIPRERRVQAITPIQAIDKVLYDFYLPSFLNTIILFALSYLISIIIRKIRKT